MRKIFIPILVILITVLFFSVHSSDLVYGSSTTITGTTNIVASEVSPSESLHMSDSATVIKNIKSNQQLVEKTETQTTIDPNTPQLVVINADAALATITVPSTVTAPVINYTRLVIPSGDFNTVMISNSLTINQFSSGITPNTQVIIPASTTVQGPSSWNGLINLPTIESTTSVSVPTQSGVTNTVTQVIEVGFGSTELTLNNPAKLVFYGSAGQHVGFTHGGPLIEITATCQNNAIPSGSSECKTDVGSDLVIYTNHFSSIGTWTSSSSGGGQGGGGGGGGNGVGAGVGGGGGGGGGGGESSSTVASSLGGVKIYQVSWNVCKNNIVTVLAGTNGNPSTLGVLVRGTLGTTPAILATSQPYTQQNKLENTHVLLYQAPISSSETFFDAVAQDANNSITKSVTISGCGGTLVVSPLPWQQQPVVSSPTPVTPQKQSTQAPSNPNIPVPVIINNNPTKPTITSPVIAPSSSPTQSVPQQQAIQPPEIEKQTTSQVVQQKPSLLNQFMNTISNLKMSNLKIPNLNMPDLKISSLENLIPKKPITYALLGAFIVVISIVIILIKRRKGGHIIINIGTAFVTACTNESNKVIFPALYAYRRPSTVQSQPDKSQEKENILMKAVGKQTKELIDKYPSNWLGISRPITHNGLFVDRTAFIAIVKEAIRQLGKSNKKLQKYRLIIGLPYGNKDAKEIHDAVINLLNPRDCLIVPDEMGSLIYEKSEKTILISVTPITTEIAFFDGYFKPIAITRINEGCNYLTYRNDDKPFVDYDANEKIRWERVKPLAEMIFHELNLLRKQVDTDYNNIIMTGHGTVIADGQLYVELAKRTKAHLKRSKNPLFLSCFGLRKMQKLGRKEKQQILDLVVTINIRVKDKFELVLPIESELAEERMNLSENKKTYPVMREKPINETSKKELSTKTDAYESAELDQLEVVKRDLQEYRTALDATSNMVETLRNEYNSVLSQLESTKKELEARRAELSTLQSERQSLVLEIQSLRSEISYLHPERQQEEFQSVKEKVDAVKNDLSSITAEMFEVTREYVNLKHTIGSSRAELSEINYKTETAKSELVALQSKKDMAEKDIRRAKNELAFIESELASVGKDENKKIMKAAGSMVAAINAKYEETKRDLEGVKAALAKIRSEYEAVRRSE